VFAYLSRRLALGAAVVAVVSFVSFWVVGARVNPLWQLVLDPNYAEERAKIAPRAHLDDPLLERYWLWLKGMVVGGSGSHTILTGTPIWPSVWLAMGRTAELAGGALVVIVLASIALGIVSARRPGTFADLVLRGSAYLAWSAPVFLVALVAQQLLFELQTSRDVEIFALHGPPTGGFVDWLQHEALPILAISFTFIGAYSRYIRSSMLTALRAPYATAARAKGVSDRRVASRHALRNSLIPFVALLVLDFGNLFSATLVVDVVFRQDGLGSLFLGALNAADPLQLSALLTATAVAVVVFGLLGDVATSFLDPRVRLG
jgi:peptide/nickel transport system permease protein